MYNYCGLRRCWNLATVFHHINTKLEDVAGTDLRELCNFLSCRNVTVASSQISVTLTMMVMMRTMVMMRMTVMMRMMRMMRTSLGGLSSLPLLNLWLFTKVPLLDFVSCTQI